MPEHIIDYDNSDGESQVDISPIHSIHWKGSLKKTIDFKKTISQSIFKFITLGVVYGGTGFKHPQS
jgi:hypothetical protein